MKTQTLILLGVGAFAGGLALMQLRSGGASAAPASSLTAGAALLYGQNAGQQQLTQQAIDANWAATFGPASGGFDPWSGWQP